MKIDVDLSEFHEGEWAVDDFSRRELKQARFLLRRLRFLEARLREAKDDGSGWLVLAELEADSLEWVLGEHGINFLADKGRRVQTTGARQ